MLDVKRVNGSLFGWKKGLSVVDQGSVTILSAYRITAAYLSLMRRIRLRFYVVDDNLTKSRQIAYTRKTKKIKTPIITKKQKEFASENS